MPSAKYSLVCATLFASCLAQSSFCTGPQYNDLPGFPAYNSGCYPTTYYRTSDLGNTSPDDARSRCQSQCTADSQCSSVVAQVNKAADSNLYSGTCFFYASGSDPTGPRRCADKAYLLEGYKKDSTNACFASSKSAATKFCSSYLGIPVITSSVTTTPATTTTTLTISVTTTPATTTTTVTVTSIPTSSIYSTISATSTQTSTGTTTVTTTVATTTSTVTTSSTVTATTTSTTTVTPTSTQPVDGAVQKRATSSVPAPACVTSGTPSTRLSAACSCLSVPTSTTTTTLQAPTPTATATFTSTVQAATPTTTATITTVIPTTTTIQTTVTSATVTTTTTHTATSSVTATMTTTTTKVTTTTTTTVATSTAATVVVNHACSYQGRGTTPCGPNPSNNYCICYQDTNNVGYCAATDTSPCSQQCNTNSDCPNGGACLNTASQGCGYNTCTVSNDDNCAAPVSMKFLFGRMSGKPSHKVIGRADGIRRPVPGPGGQKA